MNKICYGCGVKLQCVDKDKLGYIPSDKFDSASYCMRCYKLSHYGVEINDREPKKINEILYLVNRDDKHTIFMCDVLNLSNRVIDIFNRINGKKLLLISKVDVLPKDVKIDKLKSYIINKYNIDNIKFISSNNNYGVMSLIKYLDYNNIRDSYILGLSNSGKSTLINKIIDVCECNINKTTISNKRNTTLDFIRLNINNMFTLIDSPGFIIDTYSSDLKIVKEIKPIVYQIKDGDALKIDKFYMRFSNKTSVVIYSYYNLECKKYYKDDVVYNNKISLDDNSDIVIQGLGFINVKNKCSIDICNIDDNIIEVRESLFR